MALTRHMTKTIEIPHEPGQTITIRKLSHHQLMMAIDAIEQRATEKFARLGEASRFLPASTAEDQAKAREEARRPENRYDRLTVLQWGITAWTYGDAPGEQAAADLDEETAAWAFGEIIAFSVRGADEMGKSATGSLSTSSSTVPEAGQTS